MEKGYIKIMIIKVFKISTMEMWTVHNKAELIKLIEQETGIYVSNKLSIDQLMRYLPIENYCRVQ
jgi:hypothetical protein